MTLSFCELFSRRDEKDSTSCEVLAHWRGHTPWGVKCWLGGFTLGLKSGAPGPIPCSGTVLCFTIIGFGSQCRIKEALPYRVTFYMWCMAASRKTPQDATLNQTKIQLASFCIPLTPIRVPAYSRHRSGCRHTSDTGQGICIPLTRYRIQMKKNPMIMMLTTNRLRIMYSKANLVHSCDNRMLPKMNPRS